MEEEGKYCNNEVGGEVTGEQPNQPEGSEEWEDIVKSEWREGGARYVYP